MGKVNENAVGVRRICERSEQLGLCISHGHYVTIDFCVLENFTAFLAGRE